MSNTNSGANLDVKKAAEHINPESVKENLDTDKGAETPEKLTEKQETPFIDKDLRTDK